MKIRCEICNEIYEVKKANDLAMFQDVAYEGKPFTVSMCGNCGTNVRVYITDLKKDYLSIKRG